MTKHDWELFWYCRQIRGWLPCRWRQKNFIMEQIRGNIRTYLEQTPDADFAQIKARFGEPRQIAAAYVDDMDTAALLSALRLRRRIMTVIGAVAAAVLVSWGATVGWAIWRVENSANGDTYQIIAEGTLPRNEDGELLPIPIERVQGD